MKEKLIKLTAFLLILAGIASSCNPENPDPKEPNYPIDISFTEYSLDGTGCQWTNLNYDENIVVINNVEELEQYLECSGESFPPIDFTKNSLLLVSGEKQNGIHRLDIENFVQTSKNQYKLEVTVSLNDDISNKQWHFALILKKISFDDNIGLNLTTIAYNIEKLWEQPLEIIQATILGKWEVPVLYVEGCFGDHQYSFTDFFVDITIDKVFFLGNPEHISLVTCYGDSAATSSTYHWKKKLVYNKSVKQYTTYVLQFDDFISAGYANGRYFEKIINDTLYVWEDFCGSSCQYYGFVRINR
jgi:hypothetical protein